jgi:hypothetical protein
VAFTLNPCGGHSRVHAAGSSTSKLPVIRRASDLERSRWRRIGQRRSDNGRTSNRLPARPRRNRHDGAAGGALTPFPSPVSGRGAIGQSRSKRNRGALRPHGRSQASGECRGAQPFCRGSGGVPQSSFSLLGGGGARASSSETLRNHAILLTNGRTSNRLPARPRRNRHDGAAGGALTPSPLPYAGEGRSVGICPGATREHWYRCVVAIQAGVQRGAALLPGAWGCPQASLPFWEGRGGAKTRASRRAT